MIVTPGVALRELEKAAEVTGSDKMRTWADVLRRRISDLERALQRRQEGERGKHR